MKDKWCESSIQKRFILNNILVILFSVLLGGYFTGEVLTYVFKKKKMDGPANLVYHLANSSKADILLELAERPSFPVDYWIVDSNMSIFSTSKPGVLPPFKKANLPKIKLHTSGDVLEGVGAVKLDNFDNRYAIYKFKGHKKQLRWFYLILFVCFFSSFVIGNSAFYLFFMRQFKKHRKQIELFLEELQRGNLKARIPVKVKNERDLALNKFNTMADEIERLVEEIRRSDQSRVALLQELAHDLRTPVASLRSMLETLFDKWKQVPEETKREFVDLSLREVKYFSRLVEDLLFLARVSEPKYKIDSEDVAIGRLIEGAINAVGQTSVAKGVSFEFQGTEVSMIADRLLLDRLLRNGLTNACSFAKNKVEVICETLESGIRIVIRDDGKGFDAESLEKFGERKFSRKINERSKDGRLTVGLGSVIMKRIVETHAGEISIGNIRKDGKVLGAEIEIFFPKI